MLSVRYSSQRNLGFGRESGKWAGVALKEKQWLLFVSKHGQIGHFCTIKWWKGIS